MMIPALFAPSLPGIAVRRTASLPLAYARPSTSWPGKEKTWMPGIKPGMTPERLIDRSCLYLAERGDLELVLMVANGAGDEAGGDRGAVIMADRHQPHRIDAVLLDDQRTKL